MSFLARAMARTGGPASGSRRVYQEIVDSSKKNNAKIRGIMPSLYAAGNHAESIDIHPGWSIFGPGEDQTSKFDFIFEESVITFGYTISHRSG